MNYRQLSLFVRVAQEGSFSKAEVAEHLSKQAIIAQVNAIEDEVGVPLLERTSHGVRLTAAGSEFLLGAQRLLSDYDALIARVRTNKAQLRLASIEHHVLLGPVVESYRNLCPEVQVSFSIFSRLDEASLVRDGLIDVGEMPFSPGKDLRGLAYTSLLDAPYLCVMRPDDPLAGQNRLHFDDLAGRRVVLIEQTRGCMYRDTLIRALSAHAQVEMLSDKGMRKVAVVDAVCGAGDICLSPSPFLRQMTGYVVAELDEPFSQQYGVVCRKQPSAATRRFIELAEAFYAQSLSPLQP